MHVYFMWTQQHQSQVGLTQGMVRSVTVVVPRCSQLVHLVPEVDYGSTPARDTLPTMMIEMWATATATAMRISCRQQNHHH
jgi:hypothetical protein